MTIKTLSLAYTKLPSSASYSFDLDVEWDLGSEIPNVNQNSKGDNSSLEAIIKVSKEGAQPMKGMLKGIANFHGSSLSIEVDFDGKDKIYKFDVDIDDELKVSG
ncbi:MAG: hypothetical protein JKY48_07395, partial [Flavobacteriales bacterium]|nr:hypothetical protein [Flavobacteriales bacterium]